MIQYSKNRGFTLVELIVAVGLFTVVMFIATGALLSVVALNKKAQAQQSAINNLNFALENMARSIRTGSNYHCDVNPIDNRFIASSWQESSPQDCTNGGGQIVFESERGDGGNDNSWGFWLEGNSIMAKKTKNGEHIVASITAPEIYIVGLRFFVTGV